MSARDPSLRLRPIEDGDRVFLQNLYASTRQAELAASGWSQDQIDEFLVQQFRAQHDYYLKTFAAASFDLLELAGAAVGRLYVDRRDDEIRIIDIALLPEHRGCGLGSQLMTQLLEEARSRALALRIHVEQNNPALAWYQRLGFQAIGDYGVYYLMQWLPEARSQIEASEAQRRTSRC